ncbi:hypothetical protein ACLVWQ_17270 [Streptomyces sp. CWNU-52B]|uniref:hypothetical protein n=1 Tax=unclassified Streptomyces TaxID=2593676 RepID=UPI0039C38AA5
MQRSDISTSAPTAVAPMRGLTPARALAPLLTPAAPPAGRRPAPTAAVPLRRPAPTVAARNSRPGSPGAAPAVQRAVAPHAPAGRAVPLLAVAQAAAAAGSAAAPPTGAARTAPSRPPQPLSQPSAYPGPAVVQRQAVAAPRTAKPSGSARSSAASPSPGNTALASFVTPAAPAPTPVPVSVQRAFEGILPSPAKTTTAVSTVSAHSTSHASAGSSGSGSDKGPPPSYSESEDLPEYSAVAEGQLDPRSLTDFQLDELTHRLIGRITRLVRTELRLDRERIGKLRDPRR